MKRIDRLKVRESAQKYVNSISRLSVLVSGRFRIGLDGLIGRTLKALKTINSAMIALAEAMAGIMLPAIAFTSKRLFWPIPSMCARSMAQGVTKSIEASSSLSQIRYPEKLSVSFVCKIAKIYQLHRENKCEIK